MRVATPAPERRRRPGPTPRTPWRQIELSADFFRDLEWWSAMLARRNCTDLDRQPRAIAAITGTDASDWGTGQLAWLDGQRAEVQLQFSPVEQAWSINARELLGILRVVQFYGEQLQGSAVLVEGDTPPPSAPRRTKRRRRCRCKGGSSVSFSGVPRELSSVSSRRGAAGAHRRSTSRRAAEGKRPARRCSRP